MTIIDRIFELKDERQLTNRDVELGAGLANSSLSQWKKGKGKPSMENIIKIAVYFHVSSDYLLGLSEYKKDTAPEKTLTEDEKILLRAYHSASAYDRFRMIQLCMNVLDSVSKEES